TLRNNVPDLVAGPLLTRLARLEQGVFCGPFYMLRRDRIGSHRFPLGISHCEDMIFFLTLAQASSLRYGAVAEEVYEYRITPGSAMSNLAGIETGYLAFLSCAHSMEQIDDATRRYQARRIARILFRSWLRRGHPLRAITGSAKVWFAAMSRGLALGGTDP
ncbi:hypothetical protein, partial [Aphanothece microscopica]|uniref:hypothetical protein n=1 Tax=Aphanothece microscopica TaxID=1049561 RepID=UPI0039846269